MGYYLLLVIHFGVFRSLETSLFIGLAPREHTADVQPYSRHPIAGDCECQRALGYRDDSLDGCKRRFVNYGSSDQR